MMNHRTGSTASELLVPIVLISLVAITVVLVAITIGISLGLIPFK